MDVEEKKRRASALDYALYCIVNKGQRGHFSTLQDMYFELLEELDREGCLDDGYGNSIPRW